MPVAIISSTVEVQEQTFFHAFLNWLRIASAFLWLYSLGRNAEGNLHTWPKVSLQGAGRRFWAKHGGQHLTVWSPYSILSRPVFNSIAEITRTFFGWAVNYCFFTDLANPVWRCSFSDAKMFLEILIQHIYFPIRSIFKCIKNKKSDLILKCLFLVIEFVNISPN